MGFRLFRKKIEKMYLEIFKLIYSCQKYLLLLKLGDKRLEIFELTFTE